MVLAADGVVDGGQGEAGDTVAAAGAAVRHADHVVVRHLSTWVGAIGVGMGPQGVRAVAVADTPDTADAALDQVLAGSGLRKALLEQRAEAKRADLLAESVRAFVERGLVGPRPPVDPRGSLFQRRVWAALETVPHGAAIGYDALAAMVGLPDALMAVGCACVANPVALLVPCHRAVGPKGQQGGYRWGARRKARLLHREGATLGPALRPLDITAA